MPILGLAIRQAPQKASRPLNSSEQSTPRVPTQQHPNNKSCESRPFIESLGQIKMTNRHISARFFQ